MNSHICLLMKSMDIGYHHMEGNGKMSGKKFTFTGKRNSLGQTYLVRNCVFEPTEDRGIDWVAFCVRQIEAAFRWNLPAQVSSHRVNFCGHIDPQNRRTGLAALKQLLDTVLEDPLLLFSEELEEVFTQKQLTLEQIWLEKSRQDYQKTVLRIQQLLLTMLETM